MEILDGKQLAQEIKETLKNDIQKNLLDKNLSAPKLAVIIVGSDPASLVYVNGKVKACEQVGIKSEVYSLEETTKESEILSLIDKLNKDITTNGILVQMPLPKHLDEQKIISNILPQKDVDGLTKENLGKLIQNDQTGLFGCTPSGIIKLLKRHNIEIAGKDVVIVNRSILVGKPLALMFLNENATVTMCHSKTRNIEEKLRNADIVVIGVGKKDFLKENMIKAESIVVDVGINRNQQAKKICGDVDFENVSKKASFITPVPGGVGPMTIAMLLQNTYTTTINNYQNK